MTATPRLLLPQTFHVVTHACDLVAIRPLPRYQCATRRRRVARGSVGLGVGGSGSVLHDGCSRRSSSRGAASDRKMAARPGRRQARFEVCDGRLSIWPVHSFRLLKPLARGIPEFAGALRVVGGLALVLVAECGSVGGCISHSHLNAIDLEEPAQNRRNGTTAGSTGFDRPVPTSFLLCAEALDIADLFAAIIFRDSGLCGLLLVIGVVYAVRCGRNTLVRRPRRPLPPSGIV